jgi:TonB family protein
MRELTGGIAIIALGGCVTYAPLQPMPDPDPTQLAAAGAEALSSACPDAVESKIVGIQPWRAYPEAALNAGLQGWAYVRYDIEVDGRTSNATLLYSDPGDVFDQSALRLAAATTYTPRAERCVGFVRRMTFRMPE